MLAAMRKAESGLILLEQAMVTIILLSLLMGVVDVVHVFQTFQAASESASYALNSLSNLEPISTQLAKDLAFQDLSHSIGAARRDCTGANCVSISAGADPADPKIIAVHITYEVPILLTAKFSTYKIETTAWKPLEETLIDGTAHIMVSDWYK